MLMDNNQNPFMQSGQPMGQPVQPMPQPMQSMPPVQPMMQPPANAMPQMQPNGQNLMQSVPPQPTAPNSLKNQVGTAGGTPSKASVGDIVKIVTIVALSLTTLTFIGLFIWKNIQYTDARTDVDGQIATAVAKAKDEQSSQDEAEFLEREKYPYQSFSGPVDYGQLSFQYPKTWSVYVASDASKGGDFAAYFNPIQVDAVSDKTLMALRVSIRDKDFETVTAEYQRKVESKDYNLQMQSVTFNGITANKYVGTIPNTEFNGIIIIFKIRDKTAILQTDSMIFEEDFNRLLETVQFNA